MRGLEGFFWEGVPPGDGAAPETSIVSLPFGCRVRSSVDDDRKERWREVCGVDYFGGVSGMRCYGTRVSVQSPERERARMRTAFSAAAAPVAEASATIAARTASLFRCNSIGHCNGSMARQRERW